MKIFISGISGSGKTTFAKQISKILDIEQISLDKIHFTGKKEDEKRKNKDKEKRIREIIRKKSWIIEGGYSGEWIKPLLMNSTKIIFLETPPKKCKKRIMIRYLKAKINKKEKHPFSRAKKLIKKYVNKGISEETKKDLIKLTNNKKEIIILHTKKEINNFLKKLK